MARQCVHEFCTCLDPVNESYSVIVSAYLCVLLPIMITSQIPQHEYCHKSACNVLNYRVFFDFKVSILCYEKTGPKWTIFFKGIKI